MAKRAGRVFGDNFVRALRGVLIDPVLRVALHVGRFDLEGPTQQIQLLSDPERLTDRRPRVLSAMERYRSPAGAANPSSRSRAISLLGAFPKNRLYSLLNCDALR